MEKQLKKKEDIQKQIEVEEEKKRKLEEEEQEEKRRQIKEALNSQTYEQFKSYSEQQYPNNPDQQAVLIRQLQEQHYIQYMQQIFQQQAMTQNADQEDKELSQHLPLVDVETAALQAALAEVENLSAGADQYSEGSDNEQEGKFKSLFNSSSQMFQDFDYLLIFV